jgi:hypothetical protein
MTGCMKTPETSKRHSVVAIAAMKFTRFMAARE